MTRPYNSAVRAENAARNRARVIEVATRLFSDQGWVTTTMADVAKAADLTRQTLYQQFPNKLALLDGCIDIALSDGRSVPVWDLPDYRLMGSGAPDERLAAAARWLCGAHQRSAVIQHVLDQAAVTDGEAAARLREREHNRRDEVRWALGLVTGTAPDDRLVDEVWLLASRRQWLILVVDRAWTPAEWTDWFIAHTRAALTRSQPWRFPRS